MHHKSIPMDYSLSQGIRVPTPTQPKWTFKSNGSFTSVAATENCSFIVAGSVDKYIYSFNLQGKLLWKKKADHEVWAVAICQNGDRIAVGTACKSPQDGSIYVFNQRGEEIWHWHVGAPVWGLSFSADGSILVASSWNNIAYKFAAHTECTYQLKSKGSFGWRGLYGIGCSQDGQHAFLAAFDLGMIHVSPDWEKERSLSVNIRSGFYNIALSENSNTCALGCLDGTVAWIRDLSRPSLSYSTQISSRPICGVALDATGAVLAAGSFDGKVYLTSAAGRCFWSYQTDGEVWSVAMSSDGRHICVASGDERLYVFENSCTSAVVSEIGRIVEHISSLTRDEFREQLKRVLLPVLAQYELYDYCAELVPELCSGKIREREAYRILYRFFTEVSHRAQCQMSLCYRLGFLAEKLGKHEEAARYYLKAANDPQLYFSAMQNAASTFRQLNCFTASRSCGRRATYQSLGTQRKNIVYNLARSYEDRQNWDAAIRLYELVVSWDFDFRNAWKRLQAIRKRGAEFDSIDYTGLTANLLGNETIGSQDKDLAHIYSGRRRELYQPKDQVDRVDRVLDFLAQSGAYVTPMADKEQERVAYDRLAYLKYDYLPAEDEIKKQMEMVYELAVFEKFVDIESALDVGAATGRHPLLLAKRGIKAIGIDVEERAMKYAQEKKVKLGVAEEDYPFFCTGNGVSLPFVEGVFGYVSCMMGTFAHIPKRDHQSFFKEVFRVLRHNGVFVISTWDKQCEHLSYLSMYTEAEKVMIAENSISKYKVTALLKYCGYRIIEVIPYLMIPNVMIYELNAEKLLLSDVRRMIDIDFAMRSSYPASHGEMFMVVCQKPPVQSPYWQEG